MSKYAEFRGEFDGDDENSSKLFRIAVFDEIFCRKKSKIDISGVYPPLSYPLRGPYGIQCTTRERRVKESKSLPCDGEEKKFEEVKP